MKIMQEDEDMSGKPEDQKKLIYICAPLKGDVAGNIERARGYCKTVIAMGGVPIAPHVMMAGVLNDNEPQERKTALELGLQLVARCAELWIFSKTVSEGMQAEIDLAKQRGIPVKTVRFDFERESAQQQAAESVKKSFTRLTTDDPQGMYEEIHNALIVKDREVYLRDWNGEGDISLCKFCAEECHDRCDEDLSAVSAVEFGESMDCECIVAAFYHIAVGYAENRLRLMQFEDAEEKKIAGAAPKPASGAESVTMRRALELMAKDFYDASDDETHTGPDGLVTDYIRWAEQEQKED